MTRRTVPPQYESPKGPPAPGAPVLIEQPEPAEALPPVPVGSRWTEQELINVYKLGHGPAIIGREMYEAAQRYGKSSANGILGPATRGE